MLYNLKTWIKFQKMKYDWKKKNGHNQTYPMTYFNIDNVRIGRFTYGGINAHTANCNDIFLEIGDFCSISSSAIFLLSGEHSIDLLSTYPYKEKVLHSDIDTLSKGKIVINDDVWICENVTILSGVSIGQGAVIAAGAVVTSNVSPYAIVGGVPAKVIKYRFPQDIINELLKVDFKKIDEDFIKKNIEKIYSKVTNVEQIKQICDKLSS